MNIKKSKSDTPVFFIFTGIITLALYGLTALFGAEDNWLAGLFRNDMYYWLVFGLVLIFIGITISLVNKKRKA